MAPRVGLVALLASVDTFAPPAVTPAEILTGPRFDRAIDGGGRGFAAFSAFAMAMSATGPWQRVPIVGYSAPAWGPRDAAEIVKLTEALSQAIDAARPLDAVVVTLGGPIATGDNDDVIGTLLATLRTSVGPGVAILVTARSTTPVSDVALRAADAVLPAASAMDAGASTEGRQLALLLRLMRGGAFVPCTHAVRLPLLWARTGKTLVRLDELAGTIAHQARAAGLVTAGIASGTPWFDSSVQGLTVLGVGEDRDAVRRFTLDAAAHVWHHRSDGVGSTIPIPDAVAAARDPSRPPTLFIDNGDRIDLGGLGHGTDLLAAVAWSGASDVLVLGHVDAEVVEAALRAGVGATISAAFNRAAGGDLFEVEAQVVALDETQRMAALMFGGMTAVVSTRPMAAADVPALLDRHGLALPRVTIAKFVPPMVMFGEGAIWPSEWVDVRTTGAANPTIEARTYSRIPRPIYPLDQDIDWPPKDPTPEDC